MHYSVIRLFGFAFLVIRLAIRIGGSQSDSISAAILAQDPSTINSFNSAIMPQKYKNIILSDYRPTKDELEIAKKQLNGLSAKEKDSRASSLRQFLKNNPDPAVT
jgi:hypothetical protein